MEYPERFKVLPSDLHKQLEFYRYGPVKVSAERVDHPNITIFLELLNPYVHQNHIYFTVSAKSLKRLVTTDKARIKSETYTIFNAQEGLELSEQGSYVHYTRVVSDSILEKLARVLADYESGTLLSDDLTDYPNVP